MAAVPRQLATLTVLAALVVPVGSAFLHHQHASATVPASDPHDARHHLCERFERLAGPNEGCPICLSQRSLGQSLVVLEREPMRLAAVGFALVATGAPSPVVPLRARSARAPPAR